MSSPAQEAWADAQHRVTYAEAAARVSRLAAGLIARGVGPGDRVVVWCDLSVEAAAALFAVWAAGAVAVPVHPTLVGDQVASIVADCGARLLIVLVDRRGEGLAIAAAVPDVTVVFGSKVARGAGDAVSLDEVADLGGAGGAPVPDRQRPEEIAAIIYTSGSSGPPKGVVHTHASLLAGTRMSAALFEITDRDRILLLVPFSFIAGVGQLICSAFAGSLLVVMRFVLARTVVERMASEAITVSGGTSLVWQLLSQQDSRLATTPLPRLRLMHTGGGFPHLPTLQAVQRAVPGMKVLVLYSQTECQRCAAISVDDLVARPGRAGELVPGAEVFIVAANGELCPPGEVGEIAERNPSLAQGYWNRPAETARAWRPDAWSGDRSGRVFFTGDFGLQDPEGRLHLVGRRDALIKSYGYRISPTEVENALFKHPDVAVAAVVGAPDPACGQIVAAFVSLRPGSSLEPWRLSKFLQEHLPRYMLPGLLEFLDALPRLGNGKIDTPSLRERAAQLWLRDRQA